MNPSPALNRPFNPPPRLIDTRLPRERCFVPVTVTRRSPTPEFLEAVERLWQPERDRLAADLRAHGETLQSGHWRWTWKAEWPAHWHSLVTVECEGQVQGIMAVESLLRPSVLSAGEWVLYLDFVEVAPWNYRMPQNRNRDAVREPRFRRVGTLLLGEAIRLSMGATARGRVGLHSLGQSEEFYTHCGMTRLGLGVGPDPRYHGLAYFEYAEGVSAQQLTDLELSA